MTDDETWAAAVDADPADLLCRGTYANWLRDRGRDAEADAWGWLNRIGRVPCHWPNGLGNDRHYPYEPVEDEPSYVGWNWLYGANVAREELAAVLVNERDGPNRLSPLIARSYATASAALLAVVRYVVDNGIDPAGLPDPCQSAETEPAGA